MSINFLAGQYAEVHIVEPGSTSKIQRIFTISSNLDESYIEIITRYDRALASVFKHTLFALQLGDTVQISEPQGDFVLPKDTTIPLVFVALGLGITPYMSMAEWLAARDERRNITLLRQAKNRDELLGRDLFATAGFTVIDHLGRLPTANLLRTAPITPRTLIYIAGPETAVITLQKELISQGIKPYQIVTDAFLGYSE